jgi:5-methylcytosine-specific restriction endonuclease McrA
MKVCSVDGCESVVRCKSMCGVHYRRSRKGLDLSLPYRYHRTGPYRNAGGSRTTYEDRVAARNQPPRSCKCGCGGDTEFSATAGKWRAYIKGHDAMPSELDDPEWLTHQYVEMVRPVKDIAAGCRVHPRTVVSQLRKHGIVVRTQAETLRLRATVAGENNPAWRGGVTPERQRLYKTPEWRSLVQSIFMRDGFRCVRCAAGQDHSEHSLHAHHVATWAEAPALRSEPTNLVTLCRKCHTWVHSNANTERDYLARK